MLLATALLSRIDWCQSKAWVQFIQTENGIGRQSVRRTHSSGFLNRVGRFLVRLPLVAIRFAHVLVWIIAVGLESLCRNTSPPGTRHRNSGSAYWPIALP